MFAKVAVVLCLVVLTSCTSPNFQKTLPDKILCASGTPANSCWQQCITQECTDGGCVGPSGNQQCKCTGCSTSVLLRG
ncbi:hypothetical protein AB6A40_010259 [Gnathostoma spinigerum]|uniref:Uncharacterized protein n=1 Tax=Gnathostoma spinigerum TaxID=75299 RepID=A0ABD6F312_9BILA